MNAQTKWKIAYRCWKAALIQFSNFYESDKWGEQMRIVRREAALERKLEAAQRTIRMHEITITEQARRLDEDRRLIDRINSTVYLKRGIQDAVDSWRRNNSAPAPQAEQCTCGMGDATEPEYHAKDCAYYVDPSPIVDIPGIDYPDPKAKQEP